MKSAEDAYRLFKETNCDGIMIGRGSMGAPWIFEEINHYLETGKPMKAPGLKFRFGVALEQLKCSIEVKGPRIGFVRNAQTPDSLLQGVRRRTRYAAEIADVRRSGLGFKILGRDLSKHAGRRSGSSGCLTLCHLSSIPLMCLSSVGSMKDGHPLS